MDLGNDLMMLKCSHFDVPLRSCSSSLSDRSEIIECMVRNIDRVLRLRRRQGCRNVIIISAERMCRIALADPYIVVRCPAEYQVWMKIERLRMMKASCCVVLRQRHLEVELIDLAIATAEQSVDAIVEVPSRSVRTTGLSAGVLSVMSDIMRVGNNRRVRPLANMNLQTEFQVLRTIVGDLIVQWCVS